MIKWTYFIINSLFQIINSCKQINLLFRIINLFKQIVKLLFPITYSFKVIHYIYLFFF